MSTAIETIKNYALLAKLEAAYDLADQRRFDDAIAGLRPLQAGFLHTLKGGDKNDDALPGLTLVTEAIADILCRAEKLADSRYELTNFLKLCPENPGVINILARTSFHQAILHTDDPNRVAANFTSCATELFRAVDIYSTDGFVTEEHPHMEFQRETSAIAWHLLREVDARHHWIDEAKSYPGLLVSIAEIAARQGKHTAAENYLERHERIAELNVRGRITRAEIQTGLGQVEKARETLRLIAGMTRLPRDRNLIRIHRLTQWLHDLTAGD